MPSLKGKVQNNQCIIQVLAHPPGDGKQPPVAQHSFQALIDTGAQSTCISTNVVNKLKLQPESKIMMQGATTTAPANRYVVGLFIPIEKATPVSVKEGKVNYQTQLSLFGSSKTLVTEFNAPDNFDVIIGMDMLSECILFVGHSEFSLSF